VNDVRPTSGRHRLFVAATPPHDVVERLAAVPRPREPGVRWVPSERWHVTLRFLGDADPQEVSARLSGLALPAATAVLGPVVSRLGLDVVVVPVAGLDELAVVVGEATADLGVPPDPRPFAGHLTLARLRRRAACGVTGTPVSATFAVREVGLFDSTSGPDGLRYEVLARFPTA
jgi:2'-5' RNA ligase